MTVLKVKRLHPSAIIPAYQTEGAACFDIHALYSSEVYSGDSIRVSTGLAFEIPPGWCMKVFPRSGLAAKHRIKLDNCTGIIDSDYRGELVILLANDSNHHRFRFNAGDRIAQAMLERVERVAFEVVEELGETQRGDGGFGSTGVNHAS